MKNSILSFLIFVPLIFFSQNTKCYLQVKVIGKADYYEILNNFFIPLDSTFGRLEFNKLISNDIKLLSKLNDTNNRIYFHEDLSQNKYKLIETGFIYGIPINNEIVIELRVVKNNFQFKRKKFFKPMQIPIFKFDVLDLDYNVNDVNEILILE